MKTIKTDYHDTSTPRHSALKAEKEGPFPSIGSGHEIHITLH